MRQMRGEKQLQKCALSTLVMFLLGLLLIHLLAALPPAAESCQTSKGSRDPSTWTCVEDDEADFFTCNLAVRIHQCETNEEIRNICKATCGVCKLGWR